MTFVYRCQASVQRDMRGPRPGIMGQDMYLAGRATHSFIGDFLRVLSGLGQYLLEQYQSR